MACSAATEVTNCRMSVSEVALSSRKINREYERRLSLQPRTPPQREKHDPLLSLVVDNGAYFSVGSPASIHASVPPSILYSFVNPAAAANSAATALR